MNNLQPRFGILGFACWLGLGASLVLSTAAPAADTTREKQRASGAFDVEIKPLASDGVAGQTTLARMSLVKTFHGDLTASSTGEMLTAMTGDPGSAAYVALERITGTLHGRKGSFVLQHSGTITRGVPELTITVVPDSGTEELTGLTGAMTVTVTEGKHAYDFNYVLPTADAGSDVNRSS